MNAPLERVARSARVRRPVERLASAGGIRVFNLVLRHVGEGIDPGAMPRRLVLIRGDARDGSADLLFLDQVPVPRDAWHFDAHDCILTWSKIHGGGYLQLASDGLGGAGNVGSGLDVHSVEANATATFECKVAPDCGATVVTSGGAPVGLDWDPTSAAWTSAAWSSSARLEFSYTVPPNDPLAPPIPTFQFADLANRAVQPWSPDEGDASASVTLGERGGQLTWDFLFQSNVDPDQPDDVFPDWMQAKADIALLTIDGVLQVGEDTPRLLGIEGQGALPAAAGYFRTASGAAPFGVFDGMLMIDGTPVAGSRLRGDVLSWTALDAELQSRTGLPGDGELHFTADGAHASNAAGGPRVERLSATAAIDAIASHRDLHPTLATKLDAQSAALDDSNLQMLTLIQMNPFVQDDEARWSEIVQSAVTADLSDIMNSFVPADLWNLLFAGSPQPSVSGELAQVAASPVDGVASPSDWYASLATAVLTQGLANGSDENCRRLNGPRAAAWLKTQIAASKVYEAHGKLLFAYEWQQRFPSIDDFLADQATNAQQYVPKIESMTAAMLRDIDAQIVPDPSDPDLKSRLEADARDAGTYASTNGLYWAFAYYWYMTTPGMLETIGTQARTVADGTSLSRMFQQTVSTLTALDPSGVFAKRYITTLNTFLATNTLVSMFKYGGDATDFSIVKAYLQQFVDRNIASEDQQIAAAATELQGLLADSNADAILSASLAALKGFSEAAQQLLSFGFTSQRFVMWFQWNYPKFSAVADYFGSALIGGLAGLSLMNLMSNFKNWSDLSASQKAQAIDNALQLGTQAFAAFVKRGVRIWKILGQDGMTASERAASISKILVNGEGGELEKLLTRTGNATARYLAGTEGTAMIDAMTDGVRSAVLINAGEIAAEDATWVGKMLGKNLDEFIGTRLGSVFILAGIGISVYNLAEHESGVAEAGDVVGAISGGLMLFATLGNWALAETTLIAAEGAMAGFISAAGPLAIVAALAGVGLMIWQMFQKPPDPVAKFVDDYATPAGFAVDTKAGSIDYAVSFANPDERGNLMIGFTLNAGGQALVCGSDGSLQVGAPDPAPDRVWESFVDGQGLAKLVAVVQPDPAKDPTALYLSLLSDGSVAGRPPMSDASPSTTSFAADDQVAVVTQTWLMSTTGNVTLTSDGQQLVALSLTVQPVRPDANGNYAPSQASGYLAVQNNAVIVRGFPAIFDLRMSGMAPNLASMSDLTFVTNTSPVKGERFGIRFGAYPSTPMTYSLTGTLPDFLTFDATHGTISAKGGVAATTQHADLSITAQNDYGTVQVGFSIDVSPPSVTVPPSRLKALRQARTA
jgi:hypothetical protein